MPLSRGVPPGWLMLAEPVDRSWLAVPAAIGEMAGRIRRHDWSATPLGPIEAWPHSLRVALGICLNSSIPTAIYWGPELRLLYNDAWATIPAERHPGALGQPAAKVWADIWAIVGPQFERTLATGEGFSTFDQMLPMVRGGEVTETYWNYSFTPIRGEDGSVVGVFNQGNETTGRVLAERQKAAETERLRRMFDQAPGFMAMLRGPEHVFELANAAYMQLVGHRDVVGKPVRAALPEIEGQGFFELLDNVLASGRPFVGRAMPADLQRTPGAAVERRFVDLVYQPVTDPGGEISGIFVEGSDVTERVIAEAERDSLIRALEIEQMRLTMMLEHLPVGVGVTDAEGRLTVTNPALRQFVGQRVPSQDQRSAVRWSGHHPDGRPIEPNDFPAARALRGERVVPGTEFLFRDGSRECWTRVSAVPVPATAGGVAGAVILVEDIDASKRLERQRELLHAELNHRVKNILATVQGLAAQTLKGTGGDPLKFAQQFGERLRTLARAHDLLTARGWEPTTVEVTIRSALAPWLEADRALRIDVTGECRERTVSPRQAQALVMAFHELATNATKYGALSVPAGRIEIQCDGHGDGAVELIWRETGGPAVKRPSDRRGFGTRLLERGLGHDLGQGSSVALHFDPAGLRATIRIASAQHPG